MGSECGWACVGYILNMNIELFWIVFTNFAGVAGLILAGVSFIRIRKIRARLDSPALAQIDGPGRIDRDRYLAMTVDQRRIISWTSASAAYAIIGGVLTVVSMVLFLVTVPASVLPLVIGLLFLGVIGALGTPFLSRNVVTFLRWVGSLFT